MQGSKLVGGRAGSLSYIAAWMILSNSVIVYNKWILDRFPFFITLTTWHMFFATVATQLLARSTNLVDRNTGMNPRKYLTAILPIGMCYSMSLILSNLVYLYLSMSFIQLLKSIGIRNPEPSVKVLLTVCVIVSGVAISSLGELQFALAGFLIQSAAVGFEAYKNALQQYLLIGESKMSSITLLYYFAPACTVINGVYILCFEFRNLSIARPSGIQPWVFLVNGVLTFGLNIVSVAVIKKTSSVVLTLSGIPKAAILCVFDMVVYSSPITVIQAVGFVIAGAGTYRYSTLTQSQPQKLDEKNEIKYEPFLKGNDEARKSIY
ncbi:triose-phosphate transporter family-domain-containing protein [Hyaloscypha sp. PMI_1271]|nr:triose-phosphate transporter family-domain-containing protein [Hyaloscypha sp. PMI_1271]